MKYIGSATDQSYLDYWHNIQGVKIVMVNQNYSVRDYQRDCRYYEENVTEMADAILGERGE